MKKFSRDLFRCTLGSSAAEFAMVLPLLLLLIFGLIDAGRFMWACNKAEKATQMGVRYAVATNMVPSALSSYDFTSAGVVGGNPIATAIFGKATCTNTGCTCTGSANQCGFNSGDFVKIVNRMQSFYPELAASNVEVIYENIGLGYAGDPNGPDVSPLITVSLRQDGNRLNFQPMTLLLFGASIPMPAFSAALTMEDGSGTVAN